MTTTDELLAATARACARGHKQLSFVNELLSWNEVRADVIPIPVNGSATVYGQTQLQSASWFNLRSRLAAAGFIIARRKYTTPLYLSVRLDHPARRTR